MPNIDGPCCWLELCCPPQAAAASLAAHLAAGEGSSTTGSGSYLDIATRLLAEFRLVPRDLDENITSGADPSTFGGYEAPLRELHEHIDRELRVILPLAGHPVDSGEEGAQ